MSPRLFAACSTMALLVSCSTGHRAAPTSSPSGVVEIGASDVKLAKGDSIAFGFHPTSGAVTVYWTGTGSIRVCPVDELGDSAIAEFGAAWGTKRWPCVRRSTDATVMIPRTDGSWHVGLAVIADSDTDAGSIVVHYVPTDRFTVFRVLAKRWGLPAVRLWLRPPPNATGINGILVRSPTKSPFHVEVLDDNGPVASLDGDGTGDATLGVDITGRTILAQKAGAGDRPVPLVLFVPAG